MSVEELIVKLTCAEAKIRYLKEENDALTGRFDKMKVENAEWLTNLTSLKRIVEALKKEDARLNAELKEKRDELLKRTCDDAALAEENRRLKHLSAVTQSPQPTIPVVSQPAALPAPPPPSDELVSLRERYDKAVKANREFNLRHQQDEEKLSALANEVASLRSYREQSELTLAENAHSRRALEQELEKFRLAHTLAERERLDADGAGRLLHSVLADLTSDLVAVKTRLCNDTADKPIIDLTMEFSYNGSTLTEATQQSSSGVVIRSRVVHEIDACVKRLGALARAHLGETSDTLATKCNADVEVLKAGYERLRIDNGLLRNQNDMLTLLMREFYEHVAVKYGAQESHVSKVCLSLIAQFARTHDAMPNR